MKTKIILALSSLLLGGLIFSSATAWAIPGFFSNGGDSFAETARLGTNDNFGLIIETNNTERARFDTAGNFSLGTTSPTSKLHVVGTGNITGNTTLGGTLGVTGSTTLSSLILNGPLTASSTPGTSGQILRSSGASSAPAWSTATYPASAGVSGNVLTSDGTNWISSAPTNSPGSFSDYRYPLNPRTSGTINVSKNVNNSSGYTVPSGKTLFIFSVVSLVGGISTNFTVDGKILIRIPNTNDWQSRGGPMPAGHLINPLIADSGKIVGTDDGDSLDFSGVLIPSSSIAVVNQNITSSTGYTVPAGKIFVLLNAATEDAVSLNVTPSGSSQRDIGKQINRIGTAGGWVIGQPMFFYPGDELKSSSSNAIDCTINGYELSI